METNFFKKREATLKKLCIIVLGFFFPFFFILSLEYLKTRPTLLVSED